MCLLLIITSFYLRQSYATPVFTRDTDALPPPQSGWVSTPNVRGTWDIILACLTTLSLCAWTAYHPNINPHRSQRRTYRRRLRWLAVAVFVPEIVLFCAWEQFEAACILSVSINELGEKAVAADAVDEEELPECVLCTAAEVALPDSPIMNPVDDDDDGQDSIAIEPSVDEHDINILQATDSGIGNNTTSETETETEAEAVAIELTIQQQPTNVDATANHEIKAAVPPQKRKRDFKPWPLSQAFFAVCGGLAVRSDAFWWAPQLTFTPEGIYELAKAGLLPELTPETVEDKSKANAITKIIVCVQAGWFLVQCAARLAQKLPLTLLEIHVTTHIFCAFGMYLLWYKKPYDVENAVMCEDERVVDMAALYALYSGDFTHSLDTSKMTAPCTTCMPLSSVRTVHSLAKHPSSLLDFKRWHLPSISRVDDSDAIDQETYEKIQRGELNWSDVDNDIESIYTAPADTPTILTQHAMANRALKRLIQRQEQILQPLKEKAKKKGKELHLGKDYEYTYNLPLLSPPPSLVVRARSNLRVDNPSTDDQKSRRYYVFILFAAVYGSLHLAAWNATFPTVVEMWMWRASGLFLVCSPIVFLSYLSLSTMLLGLAKSLEKRWKGWNAVVVYGGGLISSVVSGCVVLAVICLDLLYPFARLYVLAESFASLRAPPNGTYETTEWGEYWPHVG